MPSFPKPKFTFNFDLDQERQYLLDHKDTRNIPDKRSGRLLIATWNIANLGAQERQEDHHILIAEMCSWYDIIAVQEVNDNFQGLYEIESLLPDYYSIIFSDKGGNNERAAFIYDSSKVQIREKIGELAIPPKDHKDIKLPGITAAFTGFDRNPYMVSFEFRNMVFLFLNVHIFFGSAGQPDVERRALETYAVGRFCDLRKKSKNAFTKNIMAMGDFNLPKVEPGDLVYQALTKRGLELPDHSTRVYSNIVNDKQYDQIAFAPGLKSKIKATGVFDFDSVIFPELWNESNADFRKYLKYYISDHRPMWMEIGFEE